jgi:5'-deoxynucleotidase YfbR-like HD superfamily hydrolase
MGSNKAQDVRKIMEDVLDLYNGLLIPYMKVRRDLPFPTEPGRRETDGEHAFMLAMAAVTIAHKMGLDLDHGKIALYALIHDLVEAHAGDVSARHSTDEEQQVKVNREHEAFMVIKQRYARKAPWIPKLIEKYEAKQDEEAKFVYAVDKQMGSYTWMSGGGVGWHRDYKDDDAGYPKVVKRLRKKASVYPDLLPLFDEVHNELDKRRRNYS